MRARSKTRPTTSSSSCIGASRDSNTAAPSGRGCWGSRVESRFAIVELRPGSGGVVMRSRLSAVRRGSVTTRWMSLLVGRPRWRCSGSWTDSMKASAKRSCSERSNASIVRRLEQPSASTPAPHTLDSGRRALTSMPRLLRRSRSCPRPRPKPRLIGPDVASLRCCWSGRARHRSLRRRLGSFGWASGPRPGLALSPLFAGPRLHHRAEGTRSQWAWSRLRRRTWSPRPPVRERPSILERPIALTRPSMPTPTEHVPAEQASTERVHGRPQSQRPPSPARSRKGEARGQGRHARRHPILRLGDLQPSPRRSNNRACRRCAPSGRRRRCYERHARPWPTADRPTHLPRSTGIVTGLRTGCSQKSGTRRASRLCVGRTRLPQPDKR